MDKTLPSGMNSDRVFYSAHFMDLGVWEPIMRRVFRQLGLEYKRIDPGVPGTYPTFFVELDSKINPAPYQAVVVKFFGPLFDGAASFYIEKEVGHWLDQQSLPVRSPAILADGRLDQDWVYLIFEIVQGVSIRQVRQSLSSDALGGMAKQMGTFIKALHTTSADSLPGSAMTTGTPSWSGYMDFLEHQRASCLANHQHWGDLPAQLLPQVPDFLLPVAELLDLSSSPHLIHTDLTGDHLLGRLVSDSPAATYDLDLKQTRYGWESLAVIDWGDARIGNILYELVAVYADLFQADKRLMKICLEAYGLPDFYRQDFRHKALCMLLLHQFPMPASLYAPYMHVKTMQELADGLFGS